MLITRLSKKEKNELKKSKKVNKHFYDFTKENHLKSKEEDLNYLESKFNMLLIVAKREFEHFDLYFDLLFKSEINSSNHIVDKNNISCSQNCQKVDLKIFKKIEKVLKLIFIVKQDINYLNNK